MLRFIANVIWLLLAGLPLAIGYAVFGLVAFVLIITIPFGIASFRLANYALWPFGRRVVRRPGAGAGATIGNVIWFLIAGLWLAIAQVVSGIALCLTIIGIPFGIACFKMAGLALFPLGKDIVDANDPTAAHSGIHEVTPVGR
jgi:uncharacterized membrane protein YccF (DUF307 family)